MTTATHPQTLGAVLDQANPDFIPSALQQAKLGTMLTPTKVVFTGLTAAAAHNITDAAHQAAASVTNYGGTAVAPPLAPLLPVLQVLTCRVTAGAATAGPRVMTDSGGTAGAPGANGPGIALISDDGKTITFDANVTAFVLEYMPQTAVVTTSAFTNERLTQNNLAV